MSVRSVLEDLVRKVETLEIRVDVLFNLYKQLKPRKFYSELPDHLRKTIETLVADYDGWACASEIAEKTKRARAVESGYLNQLVLLGYLLKSRKGRKAYFTVIR